jgi:hypothetical protein
MIEAVLVTGINSRDLDLMASFEADMLEPRSISQVDLKSFAHLELPIADEGEWYPVDDEGYTTERLLPKPPKFDPTLN